METVRIKVADIAEDARWLDEEDGKRVYAIAKRALDGGKAVDLDFSGVGTLFAVFLSEAVGQVYMDYDEGFLNDRVRMSGMSRYVMAVVNAAIGTAKWYKRDPEGYKMAMEEILEEEWA